MDGYHRFHRYYRFDWGHRLYRSNRFHRLHRRDWYYRTNRFFLYGYDGFNGNYGYNRLYRIYR